MEEYESLCQEVVVKVTRYIDSKGWCLMRNQEGVIVYQKRSSDFPGMMFKVEGLVNGSPEQVSSYLDIAPNSPRLEWDKRLAGIDNLEIITPNIILTRSYTTSELAGIITARDFIDLITTVRTSDYLAHFAISVTGDKFPIQPNFVRGFNYPSGIFCFSVQGEPNVTNVVCILQPDVRGSVPSELIDAVMPSSCEEFYRCLRQYVEKKKDA